MWYRYALENIKDLINSKKPSLFFKDKTLENIFMAVFNLKGVPQNPLHHPEGDAFVHTLQTMDSAATIANRENLSIEDRQILILSALLHDIGKSVTTTVILSDGRQIPYSQYNEKIDGPGEIKSYGHADALINEVENICDQFKLDQNTKNKIKLLIQLHMRPMELINNLDNLSNQALNRFKRVLIDNGLDPNILMYLNEADTLGRNKEYSSDNRLLFDKIREIEVPKQESNFISGNIIKNMIDNIFIDKKYDLSLIGELVKISNQMHKEGYSFDEIIQKIEDLIKDKYNQN